MNFDLQGLITAIVLIVILGPQVWLVLCRMAEIEEKEGKESELERTKQTESSTKGE